MAKIYIIAGESSGDYIGASLMKNTREIISQKGMLAYDNPTFIGIGGPLMEKESLKSLFDINEISLIGFVEVLPHIFKLKKLIKQTAEDIILANPSLLITIDSPGFTYRVAAKVRKIKRDLPMIHIVAPSVWAYKPDRALKYAKIYNHLLALLPFEPQYFTKLGLPSTCIGHPILEQSYYSDKIALRTEFKISPNVKILCVTPGSRKGEIIRHMPTFKSALEIIGQEYNDMKVIFVLNNNKYEELIKSYFTNSKLDISFSQDRLKIYALADASLAKSGTNTIEIAASKTPMVIAYKLTLFTFMILKLLIKIRFASLINITGNCEIISEFIQSNCTPENLATALKELLSDKVKRQTQIEASVEVLQTLGLGSSVKPSTKAAEVIIEFLMNYRHIYHAGSFNDIIKHLTLVSVLNHLNKKEKPFAVLDGFAGIGLYDIQSDEAGRTGESNTGIKKLYSSLEILSKGPELIKMFLKIIKNTGDENLYPGSPLVIQNMLRAQDLLIACELHPEDYQALKQVIFTGTHNIDAYQALKAFLPFKEKRGLVFLDPPFEVKNEFDKLLKGLMLIKQRAANLCTMIWYPLKDLKSVKTFYEQCQLIGFSEILKIEFELTELIPACSHNLEKEENKFYLNKCGLLIVNPPHIKDELKDNIDYLIKHVYFGKAKCNISFL